MTKASSTKTIVKTKKVTAKKVTAQKNTGKVTKTKPVKTKTVSKATPVAQDRWQLRLYVTDKTPRSMTALANLKLFCEQHLKGRYRIKVIDLLKHPKLAKGDQILAVPTVVRRLPNPVRTLIGNLSDTESILVGLDLRQTGKTS